MNNLTLYQIADQYLQAADKLSNLDLPLEVVQDTLESLQGDLKDKAINITYAMKNMEAIANAIDKAIDQMVARREAYLDRIEHSELYLKTQMERTGITKISCDYFELSIKNNPPKVVIDSVNLILEGYMRLPKPMPMEPDKNLIKEAIKNGFEVAGAHLESSTRLEIK